FALRGHVTKPNLRRVDPEKTGRFCELGLDGPRGLRGAEPPERCCRSRVRQERTCDDPRVWRLIRAARRIARLAHDAHANVRVGTKQEVADEILEDDTAVLAEARAGTNLGGGTAHVLKRLFKRKHEPHGSAHL